MRTYYSILFTAITLSALLVINACKPEAPSPLLIERARDNTLAILDSLKQDSAQIIGNVELTSEFYDDKSLKYILNYEIETGMDSANIIRTKASAFLDRSEDKWTYRFVFDKTYKRPLHAPEK